MSKEGMQWYGEESKPSGALAQPSYLVDRPVPKHGLAVDVACFYRTEVAAIARKVAMIAQDEERTRRNHYLGIGQSVLVRRGYVIFLEHLVIHKDATFHYANVISRHAYHTLDEALLRVPGIAEYDNITSLDRFDAIDELIDEDPLLVVQGGHHGSALDFDRLVKE